MKPMEKLWKNKIPRFDTFWGGGWKGSDLLSFILLKFCYSLTLGTRREALVHLLMLVLSYPAFQNLQ